MRTPQHERASLGVLLVLASVPCLALAVVITGLDIRLGGVATECLPVSGCKPSANALTWHFAQHVLVFALPVIAPLGVAGAWRAYKGWTRHRRRVRHFLHAARRH